MPHNLYQQGDVRPVPDPTVLTQQMILREIAHANALAQEVRLTAQMEIQGLRTQIEERDERVATASLESRAAVSAAFASQERAIMKSEQSVAKQLDQHAALLATTAAGLADKIDDMKERLVLIEGTHTGARSASMSVQSIITLTTGVIVGGGGLILALLRHPT
jgi:hypothetical protein